MTDAFFSTTATVKVDPAASEWKAFFQAYSNVVLVANSAETDIASLLRDFPQDTLFIFFNKVYKVLDVPFPRPAILACRSGMMGANIVHRREVPEVLKFFDRDTFLGVVNIKVGPDENLSPPEAFGDVPVKHLDLSGVLLPFYPQDKAPTTGFGLCVWLRQIDVTPKIHLAGFSSKRSEKWKVFDVHDWTFEQVVLRLLFRHGEVDLVGGHQANPYAALQQHFPRFTQSEIALTAGEVLSERLQNLSSVVDRLMSVTKVLRFFDNTFRKVRPKTRKQKFLQKRNGRPE
ncbi:hypothetical protein RM190_09190 [Paracoccus sp. CPCC 101403]|uniref:3-deoxy-manno-octulosonate cytidylyltransferase n=2 Tax=Paracoccus broussonetiae TaxID=3075834 RepID=A0ABU3ECR3_9RHOB|nr:hypothetical protein [Paracoccus sp. CPCC 101403]MDT1062029.1 hypothetical protein [Paracoccus sp. CPCC 101403]